MQASLVSGRVNASQVLPCVTGALLIRHQKSRAAAIPSEWVLTPMQLQETKNTTRIIDLLPNILPSQVVGITALSATELAVQIKERQFSSVQVAEAFCHRAAVAQQLTNCLTEIFFANAIEQARNLDHIYETTGKLVGPLHGVPVSVKDHYNVKGQPTTAGYISYANHAVKSQDAHIVEIMRNAGAVIYAKTNNPQCMMVLETVSNIYGRTLNPWNTALGAGGSSGGEASLIAQRGSPLGIASDIGGSIRVPAAYNGLYGFKPSGKRVPTSGWECTMAGAESITAVAGPISQSVQDLELFLQVTLDAQPWLKEPLLALPWKSQTKHLETQKLTVGLMLWDEVVLPHPYITRVLRETAESLRQAGHEVIDFAPYDHKRAWDEILLPLYFTDGGLDIKQTLAAGNELMLPSAEKLLSDPIVKHRSTHEVWKKWAATAQASRSGRAMDVLLCPAAPLQGTPHDVKPWWGYCAQWNLLDYPSGVLPAGRVLGDDAYPEGYQPVNDLDRENAALYDNSVYLGMPVAIQAVALTHQDEMLMGAMAVIDKLINVKRSI
ncbi:acetamidase-like protein [Beauveria bassiana ARSEF 2860]|uniref:amidase n=1 Tax=Beauveria bassiana (strain ARSEF 2860) TaxID=655819 RepID=J5JLE5_BEAB2|nr:acetamidase-like protein [Beauveria bassiana ARSEF 2860]EJP66183.1 acetamidase-like protein [Beauveria bassiana ARSEF 2860]